MTCRKAIAAGSTISKCVSRTMSERLPELNEIVSEQWRRIDLLERHFTQMREEMRNLVPPNTGEEPPRALLSANNNSESPLAGH